MHIAVASGKGGTGKTTVAVNLAAVAAQSGRTVACLDCDVEEPNGRVFLQPAIDEVRSIDKLVPTVDLSRCTYCGRCAAVFRYGAIASLPRQTLVYHELCHACGGCALACPTGAIREVSHSIGTLRGGLSGHIRFREGELKVGEAMSPPAIRAVKRSAPPADLVLLDAPPGTSCPVVETVRGCDLVVLVTEPTPFGRYDLSLAVSMVQALELPIGVEPIGRIPYDAAVTVAQLALRSVVEISNGPAAAAIRRVWQRVEARLQTTEWSSAPEAIVPLGTG